MTDWSFCPRDGNKRLAAFRYCRLCGFDYEYEAEYRSAVDRRDASARAAGAAVHPLLAELGVGQPPGVSGGPTPGSVVPPVTPVAPAPPGPYAPGGNPAPALASRSFGAAAVPTAPWPPAPAVPSPPAPAVPTGPWPPTEPVQPVRPTPSGSEPARSAEAAQPQEDVYAGLIIPKIWRGFRRYDRALARRWPTGRWIAHGIAAVAIVAVTVWSTGVGPPWFGGVPAPAPTPTATPFEDPTGFSRVVLVGNGPSQYAEFSIPDDVMAIATLTYEEPGPFTVWTINGLGNRTEQLVEADAGYSGSRLFDIGDHSIAFDVEAEGEWRIVVSPLGSTRSFGSIARVVGSGDDVIRLEEPAGPMERIRIQHTGEGIFHISALVGTELRPLIDVLGFYDDEIELPLATVAVQIYASSPWSLSIVEPGG